MKPMKMKDVTKLMMKMTMEMVMGERSNHPDNSIGGGGSANADDGAHGLPEELKIPSEMLFAVLADRKERKDK